MSGKEMQYWDWIIGVNGIDRHGHHYSFMVTLGDILTCLYPLFLSLVLAVAWWVARRKRP